MCAQWERTHWAIVVEILLEATACRRRLEEYADEMSAGEIRKLEAELKRVIEERGRERVGERIVGDAGR